MKKGLEKTAWQSGAGIHRQQQPDDGSIFTATKIRGAFFSPVQRASINRQNRAPAPPYVHNHQRMTHFFRLLRALLLITLAGTVPARAYTVLELKEMETKLKNLVAKNSPAVVALIGEKTSGSGSGVVVSAEGLILTAAHVTRGNEEMIVVFPNGKQVRCKVLGADYTRDVGLAQIKDEGTYQFAEIGDSDKLEATTIVVALGHPGGFDIRRTPPVRIGRISLKDMGGFLVSDCTLVGGDSGGPLFDLEGKVVGIHSSISESLSFNRDAPVSAAKAGWEKMLEGKSWGKLPGARSGRSLPKEKPAPKP